MKLKGQKVDDRIKLTGQEVADSIKDWMKNDIKESPSKTYDLGKFFFSVSTGTIGVLLVIEKLNSISKIDTPLIISLLILFLSTIIAISMTTPRVERIEEDVDLYEKYVKSLKDIRKRVLIWFFIWIVGTIAGGYAVFK